MVRHSECDVACRLSTLCEWTRGFVAAPARSRTPRKKWSEFSFGMRTTTFFSRKTSMEFQ